MKMLIGNSLMNDFCFLFFILTFKILHYGQIKGRYRICYDVYVRYS